MRTQRIDACRPGDRLATDRADTEAVVTLSYPSRNGSVTRAPFRGGEPEVAWIIQFQQHGGDFAGKRFAECYAPSDIVRLA